ncbi:MAG: hypothetical protein V7731_24140 [Amphritea sp.]
MTDTIPVMLPRWVKASLYSQISGLTTDALNGKRKTGVWAEGLHWRKAPDGNVYFNWRAIDEWVEDGFKQAANGG